MKKTFILFTVIFLFLTSACTRHNKIIDLSDGWSYSTTNSEKPDNFLPLQKKNMKNLSELLPDNKGFIWLKNTFTIPSDMINEKLCFFAGKISMADKTFINGVLTGETGIFSEEKKRL